MNRQPRESHVYVGFHEPFQGVAFEDGEVTVTRLSGEQVRADAVFSQSQYTRKSGREKVLSSIPHGATSDVPGYLASQFQVIWAIDTNTKRIGSDGVSVSCVLQCLVREAPPAQVEVSYFKHGNLVFKNCPVGEEEKFALARLVAMITSSPTYTANLRMAVITDHDLANHYRYNAQELPIYEDFYLPANFTLLYASSDAAGNVLNTLITECDKDARAILRQLENDEKATIDNRIVGISDIPNVRKQV